MDKESAKSTIDAINTLLSAYGVENQSLQRLKQQLDTLPDGRVVDRYNELVLNVQQAKGYDNYMSSAEELIAYFSAHAEELQQKQSEIAKLQDVVEANRQLHQLYQQLESELN